MIYRKLFAFLAFAALAATAAPAAEILPVSEIRSGMKGYGVTSFEGTRLERFDVEILGVLREMGPGQDLILARVGSELLEHSGVIAGMSGSPIFIDGKLIGALAYSWQFAKDPIAGITPIEEMLELARSGGTAATAATPASASEAIAKLLEPKREHLDAMVAALARPQSAAAGALPIAVPLAFGSFASDTIDRFGGLFEAGGFMPVPSGSSTGGAAELTDTRFRPGDPIGAVLLQGDFTVAASGTVTHVDGNQVWAFGHPFLDMGAIEFPMAKSEVVAVLPSVARSFKISNTGPVVGALKQDRAAGIYGEIGAPVSMIPVEVTIDGPRGPETYEVELARHPILSPLLLAMVADSVVAVSERSSGERTIMLDCEIELEGVDEPVHVRDGWAGADARQSIPVYLAVLSNYLLSNEFAEAPIERIRLNLRHADDLLVARLVRATVEPPADGRVSPGDTIRVHASLKPFRGDAFTETFEVEIPQTADPGNAYLFVGGGRVANRLDFSLVPPDPQSLEQVIGVLGRLKSATDLAIGLYGERGGAISGGVYHPSLPPSIQAVVTADPATASSTPVRVDAAVKQSRTLDYVIDGALRIDLQILPAL